MDRGAKELYGRVLIIVRFLRGSTNDNKSGVGRDAEVSLATVIHQFVGSIFDLHRYRRRSSFTTIYM